MRTWKMVEDKCYLCGIKNEEHYPFTLEETDDKGNPISREVASVARLVEVRRRFDKENEVIFPICTRCKLLTILDDDRDYFRFAFLEQDAKSIDKPVPLIDRIKHVDKKAEETNLNLNNYKASMKHEIEKIWIVLHKLEKKEPKEAAQKIDNS